MPTYEYECLRCGHNFEEFQAITDPPRSRCPSCRGKVQRLIGAGAGIVFKGSGFYVTDSRKGGRAAESSGMNREAAKEAVDRSEKKDQKAKKTEKAGSGSK